MDASDQNPKAKTVATIDINLLPPKVSKADWLAETVNDHLHCVLCGGDLKFKHRTDFLQQTVNEDAHCPTCNVRNRQSHYTLQ